MMQLATKYSIENPITVSDSGANMKAAIRLLDWPRFPCTAHMINLAVKAGIEAKDNLPIKKVLEKCRGIVGHFKHSSIATHQLKKTAEVNGNGRNATCLIQEV